jgi:hypothetical protein
MQRLRSLAILCIALSQVTTCQGCIASNWNSEESEQTDLPKPKFDDLLRANQHSSLGEFSEAEMAVKDERYDRAIELARHALNNNDDDLDLHRIYAQALEGKLIEESEQRRDPTLYKECLEEWLVVMHAGAGEERGLNVKGVGGVFDFIYKDDERYILARHQLQKLAGTLPRPWETDKGYLKRVLKNVRAVEAKLIVK